MVIVGQAWVSIAFVPLNKRSDGITIYNRLMAQVDWVQTSVLYSGDFGFKSQLD